MDDGVIEPHLTRFVATCRRRKFEVKSNDAVVAVVIVRYRSIRKTFSHHADLGSAHVTTRNLVDDVQIFHREQLALV